MGLGGLWERTRQEWAEQGSDPRPPVFILVCKNTRLAKVVHEWLAEGGVPTGIPLADLPELRNTNGEMRTIRVDSKVIQATGTSSE